uniref:Uncharacterized protein n=1 Tax=Oryza sativa subsp. indica TaxID=39946 RepID=A0A679B9X7_ORYSI|nr:hypothetical protein [Oryza sativa Indica Group]BBD82428.1 hypothetical protein [Oryza sativa Indica Group]
MELRGGMQHMQHGGGVRDNARLVGGGGGGPFIVANKGLEVDAPHARAEVVHAAFVRSHERTGRRVQREPLMESKSAPMSGGVGHGRARAEGGGAGEEHDLVGVAPELLNGSPVLPLGSGRGHLGGVREPRCLLQCNILKF